MTITGILELLVPPACAGCGRFGTVLCIGCRGRMREARDPRAAYLAADPATMTGTVLELGVAALRHEGVVRRCLQRLKYGGASRLAVILAAQSLPALDRLLALSGPATLVPVPLHPIRRRERGYNQAALVAQALAEARGLTLADILIRGRQTQRQHRLDRAARVQNLRSAIRVRPGRRAPARVILVDDILTTGATFEACAEVLREAGTREVFGIAIAREV
jgi:ComF family protein